jgi:type IV pilus assembly protein PilB
MGVEPYLIADSLLIILAQRLVRRICNECKIMDEEGIEVLKNMGIEGKAYKGKGCSICDFTGYFGRIAIYEVCELTKEIKEMIIRKRPDDEIREVARKNGMKTLRESAIKKVIDGITTVSEALTATII